MFVSRRYFYHLLKRMVYITKRRRLFLAAVLTVSLCAVLHLNLATRIYIGVTAFSYMEPLLQLKTPMAVHHNSKYDGHTADVTACVIEPSLLLCDGIGFGALVLQTIDDITTCLAQGFTPTVIWTDCDYCGPPGHGKNYWTWYFEAVNEGIEQRTKTRVCVMPGFYNLVSKSPYLTRRGAVGELYDFRFADMEHKVTTYIQPITAETRALVNHVISGYVKPAARFHNTVNAFYKSFMAETVNIGVHVRLDEGHIEEMGYFGQKTPGLEDFVRVVRQLITNATPTARNAGKELRIFLACDLDEVLGVFKAEFGDDKVLNIQAARGDDFKLKLKVKDKDSARSIGDEVFTDILLLSKCDYLVHDESSVAAVAYYFNPNLKSFFVSGDAADHRRLNAKPRFDSQELLRQAAVRKTSNIRDISVGQDWLWSGLETRSMLLLHLLGPDARSPISAGKCFYKNVGQSKCRKEFESLQPDSKRVKDLMNLNLGYQPKNAA
ncbi:uncharacterized protein LOC118414716 [Branchiostoma floridae]|uniref:N-acyl-aliphatic-L-amino acid amidohydrolase n=1 Tax=Branchiostoma floridae TaxID=7739 RepID=A0A9J7MPY0_BRAFL|nr:uncharacterized protein LOC118414716 [Branchiostoma floridae]